MTSAYRDAMGHPDFRPLMCSLVDVRQVKRSVPTEEIDAMVDIAAAHAHKFTRRGAIVCQPGSLAFARARMFCAMAEHRRLDYQIFHDFDEARRWVAQPSVKASA
jgi:hypothetical protein